MTATVLGLATSAASQSRYDLPAPALPDRLQGLAVVAGNLAWTWNREARALFSAIDVRLWARVRENPIALLRLVQPDRLAACARDDAFLAAYDGVMRWFEAERSWERTWYAHHYPELAGRPGSIARSRSIPAAWAFWPVTTARPLRTSACRSLAWASSTAPDT
jgi:hypothetical protein